MDRCYHPKDEVSIAIVGKYVEYEDSYKSLKEALTHGAISQNLKLKVTWIEAEGLEPKTPEDRDYEAQLAGFDGILVPGGFGKRGIEGMLNAIRYARDHKVPYFGICLGMQTACIEFARNVCGLRDANSSEFDPATPHRIIYKLRELLGVEEMGGTMRLGAWTCVLQAGFAGREGLRRRDGDQRAPSPSLRIQPRIRSAADGRADCASAAPLPTRPMSRSSSFPAIHSSWAASSIPSSSPSRWSRIRSSASLSRRVTRTSWSGLPPSSAK